MMNTTDLTESVDRCMATGYKECPYCNGVMVDGGCKECGFEFIFEYPPNDEE